MRILVIRPRRFGFLSGAGAGAAAAYFFDPDRGARRRGLVRDKLTSLTRDAREFGDAAERDLANRSRGIVAEARYRLDRAIPPDDVLVARVRSELGRVTRNSGAIDVTAEDGHVTLRGDVLRDEHRRVLRTARWVPGVRKVDDQLAVHDTPGDVPGLQGGSAPRPEPRVEFLQEHWAPGTRAVGATAGALVAGTGIRRGGLDGYVKAAAGMVLVARAVTNLPLRRLFGVDGRRAVDLHDGIEVAAPVEEVWAGFEPARFPEFMTHVREVREVGDERTRWVVEGPFGSVVEWDAVVTRREPHRVLAWKTCEGSTVEHAGMVRFEPRGERRTFVDVQLSYNPPAGAAGHAVAALLGSNPRRRLQDDLMRFKTLLETGTPAHDAAARPG